ncbi:MAG: tetratricopeptide repeat protein [Candidatus Obscuribacter sp.]|nr:tetratricopeptide repeat protein [Candidatus Obscuribacter sp.]
MKTIKSLLKLTLFTTLAQMQTAALAQGWSIPAGQGPGQTARFEKQTEEQLISQAKLETKRNNPEGALQICNIILKRNPKCTAAYVTKSKNLDFLNRDADALKCLDEGLKILPQAPSLYREKGLILTAMNRNREALEAFNKAIENHCPEWDVYHQRSVVYGSLKMHARAIDDMSTYIKLQPKRSRGFQWRAAAYAQSGQTDKAIQDLTTAIKMSPGKEGEFLLERAELYMKVKDYQKAVADYAETLKTSPLDDTIWLKKGLALSKAGKPDQALKDFTECIELNGSSTAYLARADLLEKLGKHKEAAKDRARALQLEKEKAVEKL